MEMTRLIHAEKFYEELIPVLRSAAAAHNDLVELLVATREDGGRVFCLGVGGGAANASHAVNDLRKLCGIEAYAPTDGIAELTARANDEGWHTVFAEWLRVSQLCEEDVLFVFSVGGGSPKASLCIADAVQLAAERGAKIIGVVGRADGMTAFHGDYVVITGVDGPLLTPITEAAQIAVLHALVSDPRLQVKPTKW